jgi:2-amino-4-hydroxy-6-hydroxymethyldihydropteridine diphosphokinase
MSERTWHRAYLSLGSNIEPESNLPAAVRELAKFGRVTAVSRVWESAPFGGDSTSAGKANNFLNAAALLETELAADAVCFDTIPAVEQALGRVRDPRDKNAPRTIDVDLSLFDRDVLTVGHKTIPDPDILRRAFVAAPLAELDPGYVHPVNRRTLAQIADELAAAQSLTLRGDVRLPLNSSTTESSR